MVAAAPPAATSPPTFPEKSFVCVQKAPGSSLVPLIRHFGKGSRIVVNCSLASRASAHVAAFPWPCVRRSTTFSAARSSKVRRTVVGGYPSSFAIPGWMIVLFSDLPVDFS
jgi:hypothetical protein